MDATDQEHKGGSSKNLRVHFDVPSKEVDPVVAHQKSPGSSSLSSASSMEVDAIDQTFFNGPPFESAKDHGLEMEGPTSPADHLLSAPSPVWSNQSGSGTQSPSMPATTGRPAGYDPNRIPSSVFSSKSTTPMEWSVASNESLFSIHIGNSSFSRDHFIMFNNKSGELARTDELMAATATLPRLTASGHDKSKTSADVATEASDDTTLADWRGSAKDDNKGRGSPADQDVGFYNTISYRSDESNTSTRSFHFPL
jgi:hypothetical protein